MYWHSRSPSPPSSFHRTKRHARKAGRGATGWPYRPSVRHSQVSAAPAKRALLKEHPSKSTYCRRAWEKSTPSKLQPLKCTPSSMAPERSAPVKSASTTWSSRRQPRWQAAWARVELARSVPESSAPRSTARAQRKVPHAVTRAPVKSAPETSTGSAGARCVNVCASSPRSTTTPRKARGLSASVLAPFLGPMWSGMSSGSAWSRPRASRPPAEDEAHVVICTCARAMRAPRKEAPSAWTKCTMASSKLAPSKVASRHDRRGMCMRDRSTPAIRDPPTRRY
mmetsp:Transcript_22246/g.74841  ORF Transcript_22246/g.74841 Transcript_22246/m.74841 type:complete len:281 (-) Transcript_22246:397-1239(-)